MSKRKFVCPRGCVVYPTKKEVIIIDKNMEGVIKETVSPEGDTFSIKIAPNSGVVCKHGELLKEAIE